MLLSVCVALTLATSPEPLLDKYMLSHRMISMGHATPELHPLLNLRKPSIALVYDSQVLFAKDAVKKLLCYGFYWLQRNSGTRNPSGSVSGTKLWKSFIWKRDKASDTLFSQPGICLAENATLIFKHCRKKNLRSFVISRHFDVCPFIIETTPSLYVNDPFTPKRFAPQNHSHHWCNTNSGHLPWNHCLTKAPRNLSSTCINEELQLVIGRPHSIETQLSSFKKRSHISKSLLAPTVRMILYYDFTNPTG